LQDIEVKLNLLLKYSQFGRNSQHRRRATGLWSVCNLRNIRAEQVALQFNAGDFTPFGNLKASSSIIMLKLAVLN